MKKSIVLCCLFVVLCFNYSSQVIFNDTRLYEGSDCLLPDGTKGTCREKCPGKSQGQKLPKVCAFKKSKTIICCADVGLNTRIGDDALHPTLKQACQKRTQRFEERKHDKEELIRRKQEEIEFRSNFENIIYSVIAKASNLVVVKCKNESKRLHEKMQKFYSEQCVELQPLRGFAKPQAIYPALPEQHPHMAALGWTTTIGEITWSCGGSLITPSFVLTAAHCIFNKGIPPDIVRIGDIDLNNRFDDKLAINYDILKIFTHEEYNPPKCYNDIALLKIKMQPGYTHIKPPLPACIWTGKDFPAKNLLMMGYGAPAFGRAHLERLYQGNLTALKNEECRGYYEPSEDLPDRIIESQICAHDPNGILDTCEGDSGGPLQFNVNDEPKTPHLVGITSFGVLCLDGNPGVYTRLFYYLDWIENIISKN